MNGRPWHAHIFRCWPKADLKHIRSDVCFSNRPFGVKRFQAVHCCGVDVARGLVLLSGIGTKALPSWEERSFGRPCRQADGRSKRTYELTSSIVPRGHHSTAGWSSSFLLLDLILHGFHAAAGACSRV